MNSNFFDELSMTYNINLNESQKQAVVRTDGPCLLLAVPGSGKTTTLLCRMVYMINEQSVDPRTILSITFSRASANDMKKRFKELFKNSMAGEVRFATIHSFAYGVVMNYNKRARDKWQLIEGGEEGQWQKGKMLSSLYYKINHEYLSDSDYEQLCNDLSYVKNTMKNREQLEAYRSPVENFIQIYEQYERMKKDNRLMDFDDMLIHCYKILLNQPQILAHYQSQYKYIQLDEAQDTSLLQHEIISLLAKEHQNVFYVADDDQSIYGFRGAKPSYLFMMDKVYKDLSIIRMEQNYRSTKAIVALSDVFIRTNRARYDKRIVTDNPRGRSVEVIPVSDRKAQYQHIFTRIEEKESAETVGLIYRNNFSAVRLVRKLERMGLSYNLQGHKKKYFEHFVIQDLLNMMDFAYYPMSIDRFRGFYYKLKGYYISKQMIDNSYMGYDTDSVFERLVDNNDLPVYQQNNVYRLRDDFERVKIMKPLDAIEYILTEMGYLDFLMDRCGGLTQSFDNYSRMIDALKDLAEDAETVDGLREAIHTLEMVMERASQNQKDTGIVLTTAHSSKGLEWDSVYLIDLIDGIFPSRNTKEKGRSEDLEEERRLFYVAMTRARKELTLYEHKNAVPSLFLDEVKALL